MPDRYWVGGTASWDGTAGTKWSATSGGAGGASVPTAADDVYFNGSSGTGTVTTSGTIVARSINCTGYTGTLTGSASLTVSGSITLVAGMTHTFNGTITINGTGTITSAGKTLCVALTVNGTGITVQLADALILTNNMTITTGTFTTNNFNMTIGNALSSTGSGVRAINLGSSSIICQGSTPVDLSGTNLTFNAGTSTITMNSTNVTFNGGGLTFYNVAFTDPLVATKTITGANIFNNFSVRAPSAAGVMNVNFSDRQTINGTLTTTSTEGNRRVWFRSTTYGISQVLVVNSAASLTDADFRDITVIGTAAPISGTRIGNLRGNSGITFSSPKTAFRIGAGNWSDNQWSATSGGGVSTDNFPLAQDTAIINESTSAGTITINATIPYCGTIDASLRTSSLTVSVSGTTAVIYGNLRLGSGFTLSGPGNIMFSGRNTQTITSVGRSIGAGIDIDTFGGTVELVDAMASASSVSIFNGTFNSKGFNVSLTGGINAASGATSPRTIDITSSTVTLLGSFTVSAPQNFTLITTGSTINLAGQSSVLTASGLQFNNVSFTSTTGGGASNLITGGVNTFNNLTSVAPTTVGKALRLGANQIVTGTLNVAGESIFRRTFVISDTTGTRRTLTVNSLSANDCDFRDIAIAGAAAGSSPIRAGDCGNNSGITFPAPKTVYWNLAGTQLWTATAWATNSGGTPNANNFPLAQDTAVIDNAGAAGTITLATAPINIGTLNASARTSAVSLSIASATIYKDLLLGTGVTISDDTTQLTFAGNTTSTITSNGVTFNCPINIAGTGTVQLADALTLIPSRALVLTQGKFDAVTFNVTVGSFGSSGSSTRELLMGSGLWSLTGTVGWSIVSTNLTFNPQTANIILTNTSTTARTFAGGGLYYNKLTIGGSTGISTTTISGNNTFAELASTKTVAHTIDLGSTTQTFGKWTVTGTVGNVVTLTGTGTSHVLAGAATSGIDYLAMGSIGFATASPGEFYVGANSSGTAGAPVFRNAPPTPRTLYWVGGTGNWSDTARWSTSSGGGGGAAIPTSLDNVIFNSASNATAYTATLNTIARCNQLTITGPASGNLTLAGSAPNSLILHGNAVFPATGFTRTFTSSIVLSGSTTGKTFTSNGVPFFSLGSGTVVVNGVGAGWSMTDALNLGANDALFLVNGTFNTNNFTLTVAIINTITGGLKTLNLGSSTVTMAGSSTPISFGTTATVRNLFTFNAGTSQININASSITINGNDLTFNNMAFAAPSSAGLVQIILGGNITVTGILTFTAGADATLRHFIRSDILGTARTITCASLAAASDVDFRDITFVGAAAPISGTRFGDCKGNSGITFPSPKTVYWSLVGGGNWQSTAWATSSGGTPAVNNFPLAQDTAIIENTGLNSAATVSIGTTYNIGSINMSTRTAAMTLSSSVNYTMYGNLTFGSGTTFSGAIITLSGRTTQTLTTVGKSFNAGLLVDSPEGSVVLQDSLTLVATGIFVLDLVSGTFDANSYNVTWTGASGGIRLSSGLLPKTIVLGSETWTLAGTGTPWSAPAGLLTISGTRTGTINLTGASAKTFQGGGLDYGNITINNGGAGALTITGNNRFKDLTATQTATGAATISLGTTVQRLSQFSGSGQAGRLLTITGASATSPATLIFTGTGVATSAAVDYLALIGVRAFPLTDTWYAGNNSITAPSTGTLGWIYASSVVPSEATSGNFLLFFFQ